MIADAAAASAERIAMLMLGAAVLLALGVFVIGVHIGKTQGRLEVCEAYAINDAVPVRFDGSTCIYETLQ